MDGRVDAPTVLYVGDSADVGQLRATFADRGVGTATIVTCPDPADVEETLASLDVDGVVAAPEAVPDLPAVPVPRVLRGDGAAPADDGGPARTAADLPAAVDELLALLRRGSDLATLSRTAAAVPGPFAVVDADGTVALWNDAAAATFGWSAAAVEGERLPVVTAEQFAALVNEASDETAPSGAGPAAAPGAGVERVLWLSTEDGREVVGTVRAAPLDDDGDRLALSFDVDDEGRYERSLSLLPYPLLAHRDGEVVGANEAAANLLAAPDETGLEGSRLADLFEGVDETAPAGEALAPGSSDSYHRLRCFDGTVRFVAVRSRSAADGDRTVVLSALRDATERRRYQEGLAAIQEQTRQLLDADGVDEAVATLAATTRDVFGGAAVRYYAYDDEGNRFVPTDEGGEADPAETVSFDADTPLRDAFATGAVVPYAGVDAPAPVPIDPGIVLPLGNFGVLLVAEVATNPRDIQRQLATVVARNLETILERLHRDEAVLRRDEQLAAQNDQLERLNRINGVIRGLNRALIEASTREGIRRAVRDRLAGTDPYRFSWFVRYDPLTEEVTVEGDVGVETSVTAAVGDPGSPVTALVESCVADREVRVATDLLDDPDWRDHRRDALTHEYRSIAAVPVTHRGAVDGTLLVHLRPADGLDDRELAVLRELGEMVGHATDVVERASEGLATERVELELSVGGRGFLLNRLADAVDGEIRVDGVVLRAERQLLFATVEADADVEAALAAESHLESFEVLESDGETHAVRLSGSVPRLTETLLDFDADLGDLRATPAGSVATVQVRRSADVRPVVEALAEAYPDVELRSRRQVSAPVETAQTVRGEFEERSSDRQQEAIELAYQGGYYGWPRTSSGADLAELMDISSPTLQYHLRAAERTLVGLVLGGLNS